ncbi:hypothetical protein DTO280E4_1757 [Paecilomyces variotii]|nr:hypothetical protein DTO280E4_1757 [Paecilomyces variotii]
MSHDSVETICHSIVYTVGAKKPAAPPRLAPLLLRRKHCVHTRRIYGGTFLVEKTFTVSLRASIVSRVVALSIAYETRSIITD